MPRWTTTKRLPGVWVMAHKTMMNGERKYQMFYVRHIDRNWNDRR